MKNIYLLSVIFLLPLFILSQETIRPIALEDPAFNAYFKNATIPIVTGKLINVNAEELSKTIIEYTLVTPFSDLQIERIAKVAKDGSFKLAIDYAFPYQQIFISVGEYCDISILANKELHIELDVKKLKSLPDVHNNVDGIKYTGIDGELNNFINNFHHFKEVEFNRFHKEKKIVENDRNLDSNAFIRKYDSVFADFEHVENAYIKENPSPYSWILENERLSDYYAEICHRNWNKTMDETMWKRVSSHKSLLISNSGMLFYNYLYMYINASSIKRPSVRWYEVAALKNLNKTEKSIIDSVNYYYKIRDEKLPYDTARSLQLMMKLSSRFDQLMTKKVTTRIVYSLDSLFAPSKADFLKLHISSKNPVEQKDMYSYTLPGMQTEWTKKILNNEYQQTINKIASVNADINKSYLQSSKKVTPLGFGNPVMQFPFGASLYKISGINASDFIAKLKLAFKNKALVIDFWATWCGACLTEMPTGKKLHEELKGQPVEFIYLCTSAGSDETQWKAKIAQLKQPGIHFFVDQTLEIELMNRFAFHGYPSYMLFNKNGQYKPGAITWMAHANKDQLIELINAPL